MLLKATYYGVGFFINFLFASWIFGDIMLYQRVAVWWWWLAYENLHVDMSSREGEED